MITFSFVYVCLFVCFSWRNFSKFIFHKVVLRRVLGVVGSFMIVLSQIFRRVCQRKNFENRPIFSQDMDKSFVACFFD